MSESISAQRLRDMLNGDRPVSIVDIRSKPAYLANGIRGSVHADATQQLMAGDASPLAELQLPKDRPVVVVCAVGARSQLAAAYLEAMGYTAYSLDGGMEAWGSAPP